MSSSRAGTRRLPIGRRRQRSTIAMSAGRFITVLFASLCAFIAGVTVAAGDTTMPNGLVKVHVARSGGFGGLIIEADVVFGPDGGAVVGQTSAERRPLTAAETALFAKLDPARLREFAEAQKRAPRTNSAPDDLQYDLGFTFADGSTVNLTFHGLTAGTLAALPALHEVGRWAMDEAEAILRRR